MWEVRYQCPECKRIFGSTAEFSHDHQFDEPEILIEERLCQQCAEHTANKEK